MHPSKCSLLLLALLLLVSCSQVKPVKELTVIPHPDGPLFVGDQVSFEVLVPDTANDESSSIAVSFDGQEIGSAGIVPFGIGGRHQATLWWVWNTSNLKPGVYPLMFTRLPEKTNWTESFTLHSADQVPSPEPEAHWISTSSICCTLFYISGTAAERDVVTLSQEADKQSAAVSAQMDSSLSERINITFMSRVVGHGGFTWSDIYVSYLDDNYIGNDMSILFHHEFVHFYDNAIGGTYLPTMLQEGLAVYLTGGHFKLEPLGPRAAALLNLGWYIPLTTIANDFYNQQHDISYLEAGALVQYLVDTYGWSAFTQFYRTIPIPVNQTVSAVIDSTLQNLFGVSFVDLETAYLSSLKSQPVTEAVRTDLKLTVDFFDTVRRYQQLLDPSAYFMTSWLPDGSVMRQRGIVADFLRHPKGWKNQLFESLLIHSEKELYVGEYQSAGITLSLTNPLLNIFEP